MLLGNAHIVITIWKALVKLHHARALAHGGRDAHQTFVGGSHVTKPLAKNVHERRFGWLGRRHQAYFGIKLTRAVVVHRILFGQPVTLPFFGDHMQKLRSLQIFDVFQSGNEGI